MAIFVHGRHGQRDLDAVQPAGRGMTRRKRISNKCPSRLQPQRPQSLGQPIRTLALLLRALAFLVRALALLVSAQCDLAQARGARHARWC